jgi:hypothetical protein
MEFPRGELRPLLFVSYTYINDLPTALNTSSIALIFADDTSVIISSKNLGDYCLLSNKVISQMSKWFSTNKFSLNLYKTKV